MSERELYAGFLVLCFIVAPLAIYALLAWDHRRANRRAWDDATRRARRIVYGSDEGVD